MTGGNRAVFFDRDGVLNKSLVVDGKPHAPASLRDFEIYPEASGLLEQLREQGYLLFVVTNQPNVARGTHSKKDVEEINKWLSEALRFDEIFVCYHRDEDDCSCRKPKPGFLLEAARKYDLVLGASFMVGDRWRDIEAGRNAGCRTVWIDRGYQEKLPTQHDFRATSLTEAVRWVIEKGRDSSV